MIYAAVKSAEEQQRLEAALDEATDKAWYRRLLIITFSAKQYPVQKLSEMFGVCQATVRSYIHAYNTGGLEHLQPKTSPGRPPKLADWTKEQWDQVLERTPNQYAQLHTASRQWTQALLVEYVQAYHGITVSRSSVYNALRQTGRRTGRSKLRVGSPDPEYMVKRQVAEEMRNLPARDS